MTWDDLMQLPAEHDLNVSTILSLGRRAIATEAEALWALAQDVDSAFVEAVHLMRETPGRIIVCGLGKSGHIAGKIASTLMSTGTPACFLHASDAVHGDLGVMMAGDLLLVLSNSGDTREFGVIIRRAEALAIPIVAITSSTQSTVALSAQICLLLPARAEACPYGSSPTTSTTMMLAMGDALAMALLDMRGVRAADLLALHPGGRLGLDLVPVESFMHRGDALPLVSPQTVMPAVLSVISEKAMGVAAVVDGYQRLLGIITDGDIRRSAMQMSTAKAEDVMTRHPRTLEVGAMARDALAIMSEARITAILVLTSEVNGRVRGLVHIHDLLRLGIG